MDKKNYAFLVGPFIGELSWEYFHFAPYIIYLKKCNPKAKMIVCTRIDRFDLYGQHADILIPMKIKNDIKQNHHCFTIKKIDVKYYNNLAKLYFKKYNKDISIIQHIYPDIYSFYYKFKWQFSRLMMDYDFKPRSSNKKIVNKYIKKSDIIINSSKTYNNKNIKTINELTLNFNKFINENENSLIGCYIEAIKVCKGVIGYLDDNISRLALLLKKPLYILDNKINNDKINLLNPYKISITKIQSIEEGIKLLL